MKEQVDSPMIVRALRAGGFLRANRAFLAEVGYTQEELAQKPFVDWVVTEDQDTLRHALGGGADACWVRHRKSDGKCLLLEVRLREQGEDPIVLARHIDEETASALDEGDESDKTVKGTLHRIANIVEEQNPGFKCSILLVAHGRFVKGAGPSLPDAYNNAVDGYAIGPTVGACGTAIYWNVPVIVEDIQKDPLWIPLAELAKEAGVAACWSHPFTTKGGRVLGALALYSPQPRVPTDEQLSRLRAAAQMTGLAVERGRAEEELRNANEVKARFLANMSHEIRTPLNALMGITHSLSNLEDPTLTDEMELLENSSEQILDLFTGVLELTEVQGRRKEGKVVDLPASYRAALDPLVAKAQAKGLNIQVEVGDGVPQWARVDQWALARVLGLLTDNAIKFTSQGRVDVAIQAEGEGLQIRIADTGCGLDLERLRELREPFVQGDLSSTKRHGGFGLGLALTDLCAAALGGDLTFAANQPQGTTVKLLIPIQRETAPTQAHPAQQYEELDPTDLPVLVVEDNLVNSKVIQRILMQSGYECQLAENGEEALEAIHRNAYCCVLMDCQMPVMDGYETTRRIRAWEQETGRRIPIIAVTANALADDPDICFDAGMDEYLKKPVRSDQLVETLERYVGRAAA